MCEGECEAERICKREYEAEKMCEGECERICKRECEGMCKGEKMFLRMRIKFKNMDHTSMDRAQICAPVVRRHFSASGDTKHRLPSEHARTHLLSNLETHASTLEKNQNKIPYLSLDNQHSNNITHGKSAHWPGHGHNNQPE